MARSYRKLLICGNSMAASDKPGKVKANRALRRASKVAVSTGDFDSIPYLREISNVWDFPKDGKSFSSNSKHLRK